MEATTEVTMEQLLAGQRHFFGTHRTKDVRFRIGQLKRFKQAILRYEDAIAEALWNDLHKSKQEVYLTEISLVLQEIDTQVKQLKTWSKPETVSTPVQLFPSVSRMLYEPLGCVLIIAPWNYPFQLLMNPLVDALAAGCCAILKPSPNTPQTANVMERLIAECFEPGYVSLVKGGRETNTLLLQQRFDLIFFTGSPALGKVVMRAAAEHLTPVVLELGGKSPCIVAADARLDLAAKRIAWGMTINAGQTCIAPDYLFVHASVKQELIEKIGKYIVEFYGDNPQESACYPRIVNRAALERLQGLMQHGKIVFGGEVDADDLYIAPTIIDDVKPDFPIMQEEIFGPLLPVLTFERMEEVITYVRSHEQPLALYYFGKTAGAKAVLHQTSSGGACVNDTLLHIANHHLPFGGVGNSGMGQYHGHAGFLAFSHRKPVVVSSSWFDLPFKYPPFRYFRLIRKLL